MAVPGQDDELTGVGLDLAPEADSAAVEPAVRRLADPSLRMRSSARLEELSLAVFDRTFKVTKVLRILAGIVAFLGILSALHRTRGNGDALGAQPWPFATGLMLMVSYSACVGGIGTPVGSPPNLIGIGMIRNAAGVDIGFFTWMAVAMPMLVAMAAALFMLLHRLHPEAPPPNRASSEPAFRTLGTDLRTHVAHEKSLLGPWTRGQVNTLVR